MYKSKEWMDWWTDVWIEKNFAALYLFYIVPSVKYVLRQFYVQNGWISLDDTNIM